MKKKLLLLALITISSIESYAQIVFEKGYFINESNDRIECLIKNVDWRNNPTEFDYKLSQDSEVQKATILTVKEFGINGFSKHIKAKINIDRSSNQVDKLSTVRNPVFKEEDLFLKVLIEGEASLFLYIDEGLTRLFYKLKDSEINQLVYKEFLNQDRVLENNYFKQQLSQNLLCEKISVDEIERLRYSKKDMEKLFIKYNNCVNNNFVNYNPKQKRDFINLTIRPGISLSSLIIKNSVTNSDKSDFGRKIGFRFGIESELILPFNRNKWGIIIEPTYQYYKSEISEETASVSGGVIISNVDYKSIELPIGVRYSLFLNKKSKIFTNISYVFDFSYNSSMDFVRADGSILNELDINSRRNLALGIGYNYNKRIGLEIRYNLNREILGDYVYWNSNYNSISIMLGLSIF